MSLYTLSHILCSFLLFIGMFELPYGYYSFLKIAVSTIAVYGIVNTTKNKNIVIALLYICILITFNPIFRIQFDQEVWCVIDAIAAIFFFVSIFIVGEDTKLLRNKSIRVLQNSLRILKWSLKWILIPSAIIGILGSAIYSIHQDSIIENVRVENEKQNKIAAAEKIKNAELQRIKDSIQNFSLNNQTNLQGFCESFDTIHISNDTIIMLCKVENADRIVSKLINYSKIKNIFKVISTDTIAPYSISFREVSFEPRFGNHGVIKSYWLRTLQGELAYQTRYYWYDATVLHLILEIRGDIVDSTKVDSIVVDTFDSSSHWPAIYVYGHNYPDTTYYSFDLNKKCYLGSLQETAKNVR
jgi:hypothetical protein